MFPTLLSIMVKKCQHSDWERLRWVLWSRDRMENAMHLLAFFIAFLSAMSASPIHLFTLRTCVLSYCLVVLFFCSKHRFHWNEIQVDLGSKRFDKLFWSTSADISQSAKPISKWLFSPESSFLLTVSLWNSCEIALQSAIWSRSECEFFFSEHILLAACSLHVRFMFDKVAMWGTQPWV